MKQLSFYFICLLILLTQIGCDTCENKSLLQKDILNLLDPQKKQSTKTGCKSCDKELMTLDIASELEKLNNEEEICKWSKTYNQILSNLNGIKYNKVNGVLSDDQKMQLFMQTNLYILKSTVSEDEIQFIHSQSIQGGCTEFIPKMTISNDSIIIERLVLPDIDISCINKEIRIGFQYYACIDLVHSEIVIDRKITEGKKIFFKPTPDLTFSIPLDKDTVYEKIEDIFE